MTKRAGKKKNRKPGQQQPSFAPSKPDTLVEDHLPPQESLRLEMRALREGWLCQSETFAESRQALLTKVALAGISATDPETAIKALNCLSRAEQRHVQLLIQAARVTAAPKNDLPAQDATPVEAPRHDRKPTHEVIQELIAKREVRNAIYNGSGVSAQSGAVGGPQVSSSTASAAAGA